MTKLLEEALDAVRALPDDAQDAIARVMMLAIPNDDEPEDIPAEHLAAVMEGLAQAERGEFASEAEVAEVWKRFDQ